MQFERKQLLGLALIAVALFWNTKSPPKPDPKPTPVPVPMPEGVEIEKPSNTYDLEAKVVEIMKGDTASRDSKVLAYMLYRVGKILEKDGAATNPKYQTREQAIDLLQRSLIASFAYVDGKYPKLGELLIKTLTDEKLMETGKLTAEPRGKIIGIAAAFAWALDQVK